ncbi:kinase-like protein [Dacryopinax primogenitus]|uniref:Kinase-like protein n=1 Tax=Dacryopinax primogenitus (strain DJM 731) TaxID=1858805 RepID=M5G4Y5_DACPD|nr:kinase-like protein [Dacryopinax primogenitus]EJU03709.1 kinase-like protein [Dacryopinax primogenitus]
MLVQYIVREANVWFGLAHPNVLPLYGVSVDAERRGISLILPWIENGDLTMYLKNCPDPDHLKLARGVIRGVKYLHSQDVIHGDIKGSNVLVDGRGTPLLTDFGLSRLPEDLLNVGDTTTSFGFGALRWMAQERLDPTSYGLSTRTSYSRAADVYALGMTLFEVFTGPVPFYDSPELFVLREVPNGLRPTHPGPDATAKGLNSQLWEFMLACWDRDPGRRPILSMILEMDMFEPPVQSKLHRLRKAYLAVFASRAGSFQ